MHIVYQADSNNRENLLITNIMAISFCIRMDAIISLMHLNMVFMIGICRLT